jgi:hypothetical protein
MKKLIVISTFLLFGILFTSAQTTQKKNNMKSKAEKNLRSTELKMDNSAKKFDTNKKLDTANIEERQKREDNKIIKRSEPKRDGLNNEASKPSQPQPVSGQLE